VLRRGARDDREPDDRASQTSEGDPLEGATDEPEDHRPEGAIDEPERDQLGPDQLDDVQLMPESVRNGGRRTDDESADPSRDDIVDVTVALHPDGVDRVRADEHGRRATAPHRIPLAGWKDIVLRVKDEWGDDHVGMAAAAVAFYSFLALIPALAATVSILGLVSQGREPERVIEQLFGALPDDATSLLTSQLDSITEQSSGALSLGLIVGVVLAVWTASGAIGQLVNTINIAYDETETRSWFLRKLTALGLTLGAIVYVATAAFSVVALPALIDRTGLGVGTRRLLDFLIWPGLALTFLVALALLYRFAPDRRPARWRWVSVGSIFAVVAWVAMTIGFRLYVSNFGSYNETYGSIAGVVVALLWLWLTAVIVLLGAEINAETEHQTALDTTVGPDRPMGRRDAVKADTVGEFRH
jgi:membrane protein